MHPVRRRLLIALSLAPLAGALGSCGFRLRGPQPLPFATLYVNLSADTELGAALRRRIATSGTTRVVDDPAEADMRLEVLQNSRDREILSLSGDGDVREYTIMQTIIFRLVRRDGSEALPPTTLSARREYNYDDAHIIAREQEENLLFRDMEHDLLRQMFDRLAVAAPAA